MTKSKKLISVIVTSVLLMFSLTACGGKQVTGECDECGETRPLYVVTLSSSENSQTGYLCKECSDEIKEYVAVMKEAYNRPDVKCSVKKYKK